MKEMTKANLQSAFGGESQARNRYSIWGDLAEKDGLKNVTRLYRATADAERVHATLHFNALKDVHGDFAVTSMAGFGIGNASENLESARAGEIFEATEMYPAYIAVAEMQEEKEAVRAMRFAIEAEKVHADRFGKAKADVDAGKDFQAEKIQLCPICGYIAVDEDLAECPICHSKSSVFIEY